MASKISLIQHSGEDSDRSPRKGPKTIDLIAEEYPWEQDQE